MHSDSVSRGMDAPRQEGSLPEDFRAVIHRLEENHFPADEAVSSIVTLDDAPEAMRSCCNAPSRVRKVMVRLD